MKLVKLYSTWGSNGASEFVEEFLIPEGYTVSEFIVKASISICCSEEEIQDWLDRVNADRDLCWDTDGDWDDPSGGYAEIFTEEEHLAEIEKEYQKNLEKHRELFSKNS